MWRALIAGVVLALSMTSVALADAARSVELAFNADGTGAIAPRGSTAALGVAVHGGQGEVQVTCYVDASCTAAGFQDEAVADCCTGAGTGTCGTFPDSVTIEARITTRHTWVAVEGSMVFTSDGRDGIVFFAPEESARVSIVDAAGSHTCTVHLGFLVSSQ